MTNRFSRVCASSVVWIASTFLFATFARGLDVRLPLLPLFADSARSLPASDAPSDESGRARTPDRYAAPETEKVDVDLSPMFSDRLPYSASLGRVVVESNFPLESVRGLEAEIVQLQQDLVGFLGVPEADEKIELCLFDDMESYRDFIAATFRGAPTDRPALYVKDSGPGVLMVPRDSRLLLNVRHEMTHAYLNASLRNVPIWIDEGLAKYFEIPPGERGFRNPYLDDAEQRVSGLFGAPPSLPRLEKLTRVDQMKSREYREAWSWVHYMIHYSARTQKILANYLRSLLPSEQEGISMKESFKRQKNLPLTRALEKFEPDYKKEYVEHFKSWGTRQDDYEQARAGNAPVGRAQASPAGSRP